MPGRLLGEAYQFGSQFRGHGGQISTVTWWFIRQRLQIRNYLPKLFIGKLRPRWHSLPHISVRQDPVQIADRCFMLHAIAMQRRPLLGAFSIFSMTTRTVLEENSSPG